MNGVDVFKYGLLIAVLWLVLSKVWQGFKQGMSEDGGRMHCIACGTEAEPKDVTKGSMGVELLLWLCFIVPGLIYSVWRLTSKHRACPACGSAQLIPLNSPAAVAHRKTLAQ